VIKVWKANEKTNSNNTRPESKLWNTKLLLQEILEDEIPSHFFRKYEPGTSQ
jgi:hypothetical protein